MENVIIGPNICISSGSHCSQDHPENPKVPGHHGHLDRLSTSVTTVAPTSAPVEHTSQDSPPPPAIQESTLQNVIRRMNILRPREQEVLPRWHLSVVLKGLMKPPFAINGTDRHISLELLSYKTAFLVTLASGARGSEQVALSRASHNLEFTTLASGANSLDLIRPHWPRKDPKRRRKTAQRLS